MTQAIEQRYSGLAESSCCLSCGGASHYIEAQPGQVCVDLGSGRGTDVLRLAERVGAEGHCYGVDLSEGMLDRARRNASKLGVTNATFLQGQLEALPLPDACADWVTSNCVLNHAEDKRAVWREIARVLKPGATFVVSDIYAIEPVPPEYRNDPEAVAECWAGAIVREEYLAAIAAAGLTDLHIIEESAPYEKGRIKVASFTFSGRRPTVSPPASPLGA